MRLVRSLLTVGLAGIGERKESWNTVLGCMDVVERDRSSRNLLVDPAGIEHRDLVEDVVVGRKTAVGPRHLASQHFLSDRRSAYLLMAWQTFDMGVPVPVPGLDPPS